MNKRFCALLTLIILFSNTIFANSYGFALNHSGFWNWTGGIILCIIAIAVDLVIWTALSEEFVDIIPNGKAYLYFSSCAFFSIIGFWFFPTYFCCFFGLIIGFGITCFYLKHRNKFSIICGLICSLSLFFSFILLSRLIPQEWWIWKYFVITILFILIAQSISFAFYSSRVFAIFLLSIFFSAITVMTINECSIHSEVLSKILYIITPIAVCVIIISGITSYKEYFRKKDKQYKTLFGKTAKETKLIINKISKIDKYELKDMAKYLEKALIAFDDHNETAAVDNLESFFRKHNRFNDSVLKGPENKNNYKDFCEIANTLANKLEYKYEPPKYDSTAFSNNTEDDDDNDREEENSVSSSDIQNNNIDQFIEALNSFNPEEDDDENEDDEDKEEYEDDDEDEKEYTDSSSSKNPYLNKTLEELLNELNSLIGLSTVKEKINQIISVLEVNKQREKLGVKPTSLSLHLVFTGNPGTGKTTVARLLAAIYKKLGILSTGEYVEVDRAKLVGSHVGWTEEKTNALLDKAEGGVFFIDEAYALTPEGFKDDFGYEAVNVILKRMEDSREDLMVIAAGYPKDMEKFISSNPGLKSRFTTFIHFDDYNEDELYEIFIKMAISDERIVPSECQEQLKQYFKKLYDNRTEQFGNGRDIRNYLLECEFRMDARLAKQNKKMTKEESSAFTAEDLGLQPQ